MKNNCSIRILVVDDEPSICESLLDYLEDFGFKVLTASSGDEALETLAKKPQDVAIIDIRLPGMNGDLLVMKAHKQYPGLRFLLHTGSSDYQPSKELAQIGVRPEHIFTKPIRNLKLLKQAIEKLVSRKEDHNGQ